ncbi:MAG TPA: GreA/GreB family elongation factor, partial [Polyangia bacterium]|nr:GreA/GreB family elongation factor [Polyangia bacterium]
MKEKPGDIGRILGEIRDALSVTWSELGSILEVDGKDLEGVARGQVKASGEIKKAAQVLVERVVALRRVGEELQTVAQFVDAVASEIQRLSFSFQNVVANRRAFHQVPDHNQQSIRDYRVLRQEAYGRYIRTRDVDSGKEEEFRVAWGAVGWPKQRIYSRNAPVIRALMSARKDQRVTVRMPQERDLEILEVSLLERHKDELKNFALMEFALDRRGTAEKLIRDLARWQEAERMDLRGGTLETLAEVPLPSVPEPLTIDSRAGLNDRFF